MSVIKPIDLKTFRLAALLSAAPLAIAAGATTARAETQAQINIPAQPLASAIRQVSRQTSSEVVFTEAAIGSRQAPALQGNFSTQEALQRLIAGTDLAVRQTPQGVYLVEAAQSSAVEKSPTGESAAGSAAAIESADIIVTAQKREQNLQDVPTSMVALSAAKLETQGVSQLSDYTKLVPGLKLIGGSAPGQGKAVLRGISSGTDRNSLVGLYLDDVPFTPGSPRVQTADLAFDPALADIERVEVLKGPQSTLYGASTMGGLIKFVTKKPDPSKFEGSVRIGGAQIDSGGTGYNGRVSVNIPIADNVALRVSAFYREDPGYIDDAFRGVEDANESIVKGVRASLLIDLNDNIETIFSGFIQKIYNKESSNVFLTRPTLNFTLGRTANSTPIREKRNYRYHSLTNTTTITMPFASLTNISSYSGFFSDEKTDTSTLATAAGGGPTVFSVNIAPKDVKRISDEIRLTSSPGSFEWMIGAWFTDEKFVAPWQYRGVGPNGIILPSTDPFYNIYTFSNTASFKEEAIFGNITYHFNDEIEATIGARYSTNRQKFTGVANGILSGSGFSIGHSSKDTSKDYLATITYEPTNNMTFYLRVASAYRPGGPNALNPSQLAVGLPLSFRSDKLWNYEGGVKGSALDGMLRYALSAFHMNWNDIQINVLTTINGATYSTTGNAGKATSDGAELELNLVPARGLDIGLSGAYINARIKSNAQSLGALRGNPLPYSPKFSGSALVDYRMEVSDEVTGTAGLTYAYAGRQKAGFQNGPVPYTIPTYGTLDLRGGFEWSRYSLMLTINNVMSSHALTYVSTSGFKGGPLIGNVLRPRTYGLSLEAKF